MVAGVLELLTAEVAKRRALKSKGLPRKKSIRVLEQPVPEGK
jgi:hypothetical protein